MTVELVDVEFVLTDIGLTQPDAGPWRLAIKEIRERACDNESGPRGATNTAEGLTRSSGTSREGLAVKATRMRALTLQEPAAYLSGVLHGDAWLSSGSRNSRAGYLCLRVADQDFADAFAAAIAVEFDRHPIPALDERGYWLTRTYNGHHRFDGLRTFEPSTDAERAAWILGMFDSEGNVSLVPKPWRGPGSWERRIAFYSTEPRTLDRLDDFLRALDLPTTRTVVRPSAGHLGSRVVEQLRVRSSRDYFQRFASLIGSNIGRKQDVLNLIPTTYRSAR